MRQLQPVLWYKGAFLQPQHLQAQDLYLDTQLKFLMESLFGYPYGFQTLTVDAARLATGHFGLTSASGVFPDGLMFNIGQESDRQPEPRLLMDAFRDGQTSLIVSLAVPHYRPGEMNVSFTSRAADGSSRFSADSMDLRDENSGLDEKPVQIARKNLRYLLPHDDSAAHSVLPVARVIRKGDRIELDRSFVPPLLHVAADTYLVSILQNVTKLLSARSQEQSQNLRSKGRSVTEYTAVDTQGFWLHYTVNLNYPAFRNLLQHPSVHPYELFAQMLSLAGSLTAFTLKIDPNDLPAYDHDNLGGCFGELDEKLRLLLETAIPTTFIALPLQSTPQAYVYSVLIPEDRYLVDSRVFLALKSELKPEQLIKQAPSLTRIASIDHIQTVISSAISGVKLTRPVKLPDAIPMRLGYEYFQLDTSGNFWQAIAKSRSLAVYVPNEIPKPEMQLVILLKAPL